MFKCVNSGLLSWNVYIIRCINIDILSEEKNVESTTADIFVKKD